ncbi:hypothetical protein KBC75_00505 [Candidatus Shapirobacteria bacterium]|nr:hypothetical protein [Candidatus Shapirobacteria bacterium]
MKKIIKKEVKKKAVVKPVDVVKVEEVVLEVKKVEPVVKIKPDLVSFYSNNIRCTFMNNQWYFSLEDILKVAKVVDPTKMLIELKNLESMKDRYYHMVETFSYYDEVNPVVIPIVNYQSFVSILPAIREMSYGVPGPFPEWLRSMANRKF